MLKVAIGLVLVAYTMGIFLLVGPYGFFRCLPLFPAPGGGDSLEFSWDKVCVISWEDAMQTNRA